MVKFLKTLLLVIWCLPGATALSQQQDLVEVVVEGIGSSPEAATKNALEQALMQAVGSFVDTNTMLEQRSVIQNEVRSLTRTIDTSMREYSQGVIEKFTLAGIENENGIYRATALVIVRSNELAPLFSGFGGAQATIGGSLFSQFQVEQEQEADRQLFIVNDVLAPLYNWSAFDIEIREPILLREPVGKTVLAQIKDQIEEPENWWNSTISYNVSSGFNERAYKDRFGLMLPYSMRLKPEYAQRVTSVLENTADRVGRSAQECEPRSGHLTITFLSGSSLRCYIFENIANDFWRREDVKAVTAPPGIAVQLLSANGDIVNETVSRSSGLGIHSNCRPSYLYECQSDDLVFHDIHLPMFRDMNQLNYQWFPHYLPNQGVTIILQELEGLVVLGMTERLAQNAASISFGPR